MMVSTLGTISHKLKFYLRNIGISIVASYLQKATILGTAFILTRVPGISEFRYNSDVKKKYSEGC